MCLISKTNTPLIAEKDIVVYKVLMRKNGKDYAPVVSEDSGLPHYIYNKGVNKARLKEDVDYAWSKYVGAWDYMYRIGKGFLHAYTTKDGAEKNKDNWNLCMSASAYYREGKFHFVTKMIIPKGTKYFLSDDGYEICAKQLLWED